LRLLYHFEFKRTKAMSKNILVVLFTCTLLAGCAGTVPKLGVIDDQLIPCPETPNCVSSQVIDTDHFIAPFDFNGTREQAQERLLQILKASERTKITVVEEDYIRVEFTSAIFRFVDDVEFYFPAVDNGKIIIHIRSASRIGYSDLGANRARIELIRSKFNAY
jgi:uncharacterized protein (DUF1499 family)